MVTIRDVAKHARVSPATASRVVNGLVGYSDETRERVEDAVRKLSGLSPGMSSRIDRYFHSPDRIDAGARGTFVADCRITSSVRTPWLSEWMRASQAGKAVAG